MLRHQPAPQDDVHGTRGCTDRLRFRCVICWERVCWCNGVADGQELAIGEAVDQVVFEDRGRRRRPRRPVSDGGLCNGCWTGLGGSDIVVDFVEPEAG